MKLYEWYEQQYRRKELTPKVVYTVMIVSVIFIILVWA